MSEFSQLKYKREKKQSILFMAHSEHLKNVYLSNIFNWGKTIYLSKIFMFGLYISQLGQILTLIL